MGLPVKTLNPLGITKQHMDDGFMYHVSIVVKPGEMGFLRVYAYSAAQAKDLAAQAGYKPTHSSLFVG